MIGSDLMTSKQLEKLKSDAEETLENLDVTRENKDTFLLAGASLAIIDYNENQIENKELINPVLNVNIIEDTKEELISEFDLNIQNNMEHLKEYRKQKALEQTTGVDMHGEYAKKSLEKMLKTNENIIKILYASADNEEKSYIVQSYKKIYELLK